MGPVEIGGGAGPPDGKRWTLVEPFTYRGKHDTFEVPATSWFAPLKLIRRDPTKPVNPVTAGDVLVA